MRDRCIADLSAKLFTVCRERTTCELGAIVGDNAVRHSKTADQSPQELDCRLSSDLADRLHFWPLRELVDGDVQVLEAPGGPGKRAEDVQPPDREGP